MNTLNRRRHERFCLLPMYTPVTIRVLDGEREFQGHAYDISEGGVRFELDGPVAPGTPVALLVHLAGEFQSEHMVIVHANIVWVDESPDEPGPVRMAAAFTRFARAGDRERLLRHLSSGRYARAA